MPGRGILEIDYAYTWHALTTVTSAIHSIMSDDYAVSSDVGFCWALRLSQALRRSQVLAFTECPIDSQAEESLK